MSSEKDTLKNPSNNEKAKILDFSLQSSETKPLDLSRIMGKPTESKEDTTTMQTSSQEGK